MSYTGVRKVKQIKDENGKWNISCEAYDSSIWTWDNKRAWDKYEKLFKIGFDTKEELEQVLFREALDGNIHGLGGKYSCITWGNCKVQLSDKEKAIIESLDKQYWDLHRKQQDLSTKLRHGIQYSYTQLNEKFPEFKALSDELNKLSKEKSEFRYNSYFKRWKEYLKQQNKNRATGKVYVVKLDYNGYNGVYVSSKGYAQTVFKYNIHGAKLFTKSIEELTEMFTRDKYSNVEFIEVQDYIKGKGKRRYVEVDWNTEAKLNRVKL